MTWNDPLVTEEEYLEFMAEWEEELRQTRGIPPTRSVPRPTTTTAADAGDAGEMRLRSGRAVRAGNLTPPASADADVRRAFRPTFLGQGDRLAPIPEWQMSITTPSRQSTPELAYEPPSRQATPEDAEPPPVRRRSRMSALFDEPPSKKRRIQILNVTEAATIRAEATEAKSAVQLSNCAICQEDDAPMDTVFTGCGHVSTCMSCTLRLVSDFNGRSIENGEARCPACRHVSIPVRLRAM